MPASKVWVTGLTVGAIAAVTVLAVQADKGPKPHAVAARPSASATAHPKPTRVQGARRGAGRLRNRAPYRLLARAQDGLAGRRRRRGPAHLRRLARHGRPRTRGTYTVGTRTEGPITGSDGVQIEHIVYFSVKSGSNIAFSNALDGSSPPPASGTPTGGIRMRAADGTAMWAFGTAGTKVAVVK